MRRTLWLTIVLTALAAASAQDARAAFPGVNGPIAFVDRNGALVSVGPDGGAVSPIATASTFNARYSPDGSRLVLRRDGTRIATINADGTGQTILPPTYALEPSWTADGRILYGGRIGSGGEIEIVRMNADGTGAQTLTSTPGVFDSAVGPIGSPDGQTVFYTQSNAQSGGAYRSKIMSVPTTGGASTELPTPVDAAAIDVSPDGTRLLYLVGTYPARDLRSRVLATGSETTLASGTIGPAAFSPDGTRVVYARTTPGSQDSNNQLRQVDADGTDDRVVTVTGSGGSSGPRFLSVAWGTSGITVTETTDEEDAAPDDAICDVDLTSAGPQCTLRAAIDLANRDADADTISFDVGDGGVQTIAVTAALPEITETVTIDATSQPGTPAGEPRIALDGTAAGNSDGLRVLGKDSTIEGLDVHGFQKTGIVLAGEGGHTVAGNWIGFKRAAGSGYAIDGNGSGVDVAAPDVTIGGDTPADRNVISANGSLAGAKTYVDSLDGDETQAQLHDALAAFGTGVVVSDGDATRVEVVGNWIGTDPDGGRFGDSGGLTSTFGVAVAPQDSLLTDVTIRDNTVSGHVIGVWALPDPATAGVLDGLTVDGNRIGTTPAGAAGPGLGGAIGIAIQDRVSRAVITDNDIAGQAIGVMAVRSGPTVTGNRIGVDENVNGLVSGLKSSGATLGKHNIIGVVLGDGDGAVIGGPGALGNQILGNPVGVVSAGTAAQGNAVLGNTIGLAAPPQVSVKDLTVGDVGSVIGVLQQGGGTDVGDPGAGNVIQGTGIGLLADGPRGDHVQGNRIDHGAVGVLGFQAQDWQLGGSGGAGNELTGSAVGAWLVGWSPTAKDLASADARANSPVQRTDRELAFTAQQSSGALRLAEAGSTATLDGDATDLDDPPGGVAARDARRASDGVRIAGNSIGVTTAGAAAPNYVGAWLFGTHTDTTIVDNTVARNNGGGLWVGSPVALGSGVPQPSGVVVRANRIYENFSPGNSLTGVPALGFDLLEPKPEEILQQAYGVTANDAGDGDVGANGRQNTPLVTGATRSGDRVTITGTLASKPNTSYGVELFADQRCNAFGSGEGELPVGGEPVTVITDGAGNGVFAKTVTAATAYTRVTATATGPEGTSEFSPCAAIGDAPPAADPVPATPNPGPAMPSPTPAPGRPDTTKPPLAAGPKGKPGAGGPVTVTVTSGEDATLTATGTQAVSATKNAKASAAKRLTVKLKRRKLAVKARKAVRVTLKPTGRSAIKRLKRAVRRGAKATATIKLALVGKAGNRSTRTLRIKLR